MNCIIFAGGALATAPALARPPATLARILGREFIDSDFQGDAIPRAQYLAYLAHPVAQPAPHVQRRFEDTRVRFIAGGEELRRLGPFAYGYCWPERGASAQRKISSELSVSCSTTRKPDVMSCWPDAVASGELPSSKCRR